MKMKYITIFALLFAFSAQAQTSDTAATSTKQKPPMPYEQIRKNLEASKEARQNIYTEKREGINNIVQERNQQIRDLRASTTKGEMGSSTMRAGMMAQKREIMKSAKKEIFATRKTALLERLSLTLSNLEKGKTSLATFITKLETEGKNIGNAKDLLKTAETKIATLKTDIAAVTSFQATPVNSTSTEVSLEKPREVATKAIKSANEARQALQAVIAELRKSKQQ